MGALIYGVDESKPVTALTVRDALVRCFDQAHGEIVKLSNNQIVKSMGETQAKKFISASTESLVRKAFTATGGNYNQPDKQAILNAMDYLADFSKTFRDPAVIQEHYNEILKLANKI